MIKNTDLISDKNLNKQRSKWTIINLFKKLLVITIICTAFVFLLINYYTFTYGKGHLEIRNFALIWNQNVYDDLTQVGALNCIPKILKKNFYCDVKIVSEETLTEYLGNTNAQFNDSYGADGLYRHYDKTIMISDQSTHIGLTFLHEFGHWLDFSKTKTTQIGDTVKIEESFYSGEPEWIDLFNKYASTYESPIAPRGKSNTIQYYFTSDIKEFFAQTFCDYLNPKYATKFRNTYPDIADHFDNIIKNLER